MFLFYCAAIVFYLHTVWQQMPLYIIQALMLQPWQQNDVFMSRHQAGGGVVSAARTQAHHRVRSTVEARKSQARMHGDW